MQHTVYVCLVDGSNENPLLDSKFPDIAGKGRGYQIQAFPDGVDGWSALRKVSVWQTVSSLEQVLRVHVCQRDDDVVVHDDGEDDNADFAFWRND